MNLTKKEKKNRQTTVEPVLNSKTREKIHTRENMIFESRWLLYTGQFMTEMNI